MKIFEILGMRCIQSIHGSDTTDINVHLLKHIKLDPPEILKSTLYIYENTLNV